MNEVARFQGTGMGLMSRDDMARGLNNASMSAPRVGGEYQFLKLDKGTGEWVYGQEETLVEEGSLWAVNPQSLEYGYIAWPPEDAVNREPEGELMVPITRPLPNKDALRTRNDDGKTTGAGWQYQQAVVLVCISGEDAGNVTAQYKQSSVGSQKMFAALINAISGQVAKGSDAVVPIVKLSSDSYKHKKWGRIYNPIFEIQEFQTLDGPTAAATGEKTAEAETPAPRTRTRPAAVETVAAANAATAQTTVDDEAALAAEYEAEQAAQAAAGNPAPRRRVRR